MQKCSLQETNKIWKKIEWSAQSKGILILRFGFSYFTETSAKTGFNARNVFIEAAKILYDDYQKYKDRAESTQTNGSFRQTFVSITDGNNKEDNKKKGCGC